MIVEAGIKNITLINDGEFNSFALINGKMKKGNKLIVYIENMDYISYVTRNKEIRCIICSEYIYEKIQKKDAGITRELGIVISDNPRTCFFLFHNFLNRYTAFYKSDFEKKIDSTAQIHNTCILPEKNIIIGKNVILNPNVVIYENVWIGDNVFIGAGSVIGQSAFYYFNNDGIRSAVDTTGTVVLESNVEIQSYVTICRGTLGGSTRIGSNTKIDSYVFVGHDVTIKESCLITAGTVFAGSVTLNENCFVGIGSKITPQINVGRNTMISAGSIVVRNVKENSHISGNFAVDHIKYVRHIRDIEK